MSAAPLGASRDARPLRLLGPDDVVTEPGTNGGPATIALVALEAKRNDDLRDAEEKRQDDLRLAEIRRRDDLFSAEFRHRGELSIAESKRLDALRAVDVAAVALANTRAELEAKALAERVDTSAKTLAAQVEATAKANAEAVAATALALSGRITPLEQARYEQAGGKSQQTETRAQSNWTFERALTILGLAVGAVYFLLQSGVAK